jgi:hypothetical protein
MRIGAALTYLAPSIPRPPLSRGRAMSEGRDKHAAGHFRSRLAARAPLDETKGPAAFAFRAKQERPNRVRPPA